MIPLTQCKLWLVAGMLALQTGCTTLKRAEKADGLLDFVMLLAGTAKPDVVPVEKASQGNGTIVSAQATADRGWVSVRGSLRKTGLGQVTTAYSHVDVIVLDSRRKAVEGVATTYFPSEIPATYHGVPGQAHFSAALPRPLPPGATIQVIFHGVPLHECKFHQQT